MATRTAIKAPYHHGNLETALVDAAIVLVRKYGPDHLSLRAVSAEVGVSPSASYHHFGDKDALVSAIGNVLFDRLAIMQEKAIAKVKKWVMLTLHGRLPNQIFIVLCSEDSARSIWMNMKVRLGTYFETDLMNLQPMASSIRVHVMVEK